MKFLAVPYLPNIDYTSSWESVSKALEDVPDTVIGETPWAAYPYKPTVALRMGYMADAFVLRFVVDEEVAQANYPYTQGPVHKDSCVEFFVSFDEGANYYNLEFNCIDTRMMAYGKDVVSERTLLPVDLVETIRTHSSLDLNRSLAEQGQWELVLVIPFQVFMHERKLELSGKTIRGNFFKCGDELPTPHFVTWNSVDFPKPSFHQPGSFGKLAFLSP